MSTSFAYANIEQHSAARQFRYAAHDDRFRVWAIDGGNWQYGWESMMIMHALTAILAAQWGHPTTTAILLVAGFAVRVKDSGDLLRLKAHTSAEHPSSDH